MAVVLHCFALTGHDNSLWAYLCVCVGCCKISISPLLVELLSLRGKIGFHFTILMTAGLSRYCMRPGWVACSGLWILSWQLVNINVLRWPIWIWRLILGDSCMCSNDLQAAAGTTADIWNIFTVQPVLLYFLWIKNGIFLAHGLLLHGCVWEIMQDYVELCLESCFV